MKLLTCLTILGGFIHSATGATYYVSPTGSDSNNGTSIGTPWQTIAKVNGNTYQPGDSVLFQGGSSFSGSLNFTVRASSASPFTVGSYGAGAATIATGTAEGLFAYNCSGVILENLDFIGSGAGSNTNNGVEFYADLSGNVQLGYIRINNVSINGFGQQGLRIGAWNNLTGYNDVRVTNVVVHDNRKDGMQVYAQARGANINIYVGDSQFYNNTGIAGQGTATGSGVVFAEVNGGTIERCTAYNNGASNTSKSGPIGIWCYDSSSILIQYNESYGNKSGGGDGDGFDLDGGTTNSYLQYNYSHDNIGSGFCLFEYGASVNNSENVVRYNVSFNDPVGVQIWSASSYKPVTGAKIYGNTLASRNGIYFSNSNCTGLVFSRNIITVNGQAWLIEFPGSTGASFDYDDVWQNGQSFVIGWNGQTYSSLSAFQSASGQEKNATNINPSPFAGSAPSYWTLP